MFYLCSESLYFIFDMLIEFKFSLVEFDFLILKVQEFNDILNVLMVEGIITGKR